MSVRRREWRDRKTGKRHEAWMVDIKFEHPDGRVQRIRKVSPVQTRRGAEAYEREVRQSLLAGTFGRKEDKRITVAQFAKEFVSTYAETNNKPSEVESKQMILDVHLVPALGSRTLEEIGQQHIEAYKSRKLKAGLSPKTINNHLTVLRKMLSVAVEWGKLEHVPRVKWLKVPEPDFDFLDFEETDRLIAGADDEWRPMVIVALKTGLRLGELLALRWCDVDLKARKLFVRRNMTRGVITTPKGGRSREVPLTRSACAALRAHRHLKGELVFCDERGDMLTKGKCKWPLWRACDRAELRRIGWHCARHSFASALVMRGVPIKTVQELLGHTDIRITLRYAHLSVDVRSEAVDLLDQEPPTSVHARGTLGTHGPTEDEKSSDIK